MNIFVTGATGWVGSAIVHELLQAGHRVSGLVRSDANAALLAATGATAVRGSLDDLGQLTRTAAASDAVIHTAFNHDFSRFAENAEQDRRAIRALGAGLRGSGRPLVITSGTALVSPGRVATEDMPQGATDHPRQSEFELGPLACAGVRITAVRLAPSVHGVGDHGFVPMLIDLARRTGVSAYLGDGANRWSAVHRLDAARLYRLIVEAPHADAIYHGVAEEGVAFKRIANTIGQRLGVPVAPRPAEHFGWLAGFAGADFPASSARTRALLGWAPTQPGLLADLDQPAYFADRAQGT